MEVMFSLIFLFIVPLFIILLVVLYRSMYRRHVNHALNGEGSGRYIEPFNFVVVLLLIVITIFSIITYSGQKLLQENFNNQLNNVITSLNSRNSSLSSQIDDLQEKLNEMEARTKWVTAKSLQYDYKNLTGDYQHLAVDVSFSLRTSDNNSQLYLLIINKSDVTQSERILIENNNYLTYTKQVVLALDKNYSIELLSENGTIHQKEKLFDADFKDNLTNRITFKAFPSKVENGGKPSEFDLSLENNHYGIEVFEIAKVKLKFYEYHEFVKERDITNELMGNKYSYIENYKYQGTIDFEYTNSLLVELIVEDKTGQTLVVGKQYLYENIQR